MHLLFYGFALNYQKDCLFKGFLKHQEISNTAIYASDCVIIYRDNDHSGLSVIPIIMPPWMMCTYRKIIILP